MGGSVNVLRIALVCLQCACYETEAGKLDPSEHKYQSMRTHTCSATAFRVSGGAGDGLSLPAPYQDWA